MSKRDKKRGAASFFQGAADRAGPLFGELFEADGAQPSRASADDERDLVAVTRAEQQKRRLTHKLSRKEKGDLTRRVLSPDGGATFAQRIGQLLRSAQRPLPTVEIEYRELTIQTDALVGSAGTPSLLNSALRLAKLATLQGGLRTTPYTILDRCSGVLRPGRFTLLLGPPGSGKSVLLRALAGRLKYGRRLRMSGSIRYNGVDASEFEVRRTVGLVEQADSHLGDLTVLETLKFASRCQNAADTSDGFVQDLQAAIQRLSRAKRQAARRRQPLGNGAGAVDADAADAADGAGSVPPLPATAAAGNGAAASSGVEPDGAADTGSEEAEGDAGGDVKVDVHLLQQLSRTPCSGSAAGAPDSGALTPLEFEPEFAEAYRELVQNQLQAQLVMQIMGLAHAADTLVGDALRRGISGGERKRLSTAEIITGPQAVVLFDEISTGLDSATAYAVIKTFRDVAHGLERTFMASLLQPAPEVVALFDDLLLLTDGAVVYHGPVGCVLPYFEETLGLVCPVRKDPASFLQEVTTPAGQLAYATPALLAAHGLGAADHDPSSILAHPPTQLLVSLAEMRAAFWEGSPWGKALAEQLGERPFSREDGPPGALFMARFANGLACLTRLVVARQAVLNLRMIGFYMARIIQTTIMGLIIGSLFATIEPTVADGRNAVGVLVLSTIFISMMSSPQIAFVFMSKRVFYKQRDNRLFPSWAYVLAQLLTQVPQSTIEAVVFSLIVYWISGLTRQASHFFVYLLVTWSASNCLAGLFRLIGCAMKTMVVGNSMAMLLLLLMMITNGFSLVSTDIPPYMIWIYYINPIAYAVRAMVINELTAGRWSYDIFPGVTAGEGILQPLGFPSNWAWVWGGVAYLWGSLGIFTALSAMALDWTDPPAPQPSVPAEQTRRELEEQVLGRLARARRAAARLGSTLTLRSWRSRSILLGPEASRAAAPAAAVEVTDLAPPKQPSPQQPSAGAQLAAAKPAAAESSTHGSSRSDALGAVPFTPVTLVCRDIRYYVPDPSKGEAQGVVHGSGDRAIAGKLELLKGVSFYAQPGSLTALMGGSGAGKTTLMDVILGRKTVGLVRGDILVNGHPKQQASWSRACGYVEQQDIHSARTTVREALMFSARLRLEESIGMDQVRALVSQTLALVELTPLADSIVGEGGSSEGGGSGLSCEQLKRLSIGVELVANPAVMFMDEPTSGLDARAAAIVIRAVRNVSRSGRLVVVTIHQPSTEIFEAFDMLLLLQIGGRLTYFGPLGFESRDLIAYLQAIPGVDPIHAGSNPATWMLEVTGGSMTTLYTSASADFPALYAASELCARNEATSERLAARGLAEQPALSVEHTYATSSLTQHKWLLHKWFVMYWRMPNYNFVRLVMTVVIGLIYGVTYRGAGSLPTDQPANIGTVQNIMGLIFSQAIFLGMFNAMTVQSVIAAERSVFYRERAASLYGPGPYSLATGLAELPYLLVQSLIMVNCTYWLVGFEASAFKFFYFLLLYGLSLTMYTLFGQFLVFATPNQLLAQLMAAAANQLWAIFNGFLIPYSQMPAGYKWCNRISPTTYIIWGLSSSQLGDKDTPMVLPSGTVTTVAQFMDSYFSYPYSFIWWCPLIIFGYAMAFRVGSALLLRYVSFLKR